MVEGQYLTLRDLGERRIIKELIAPRFPTVDDNFVGIGDDCAIIPFPTSGDDIVVTTDPCPTPVSCIIGPVDYYHYGRLSALINVSDLAAMGARPIGLVVSTIMSEDMKVSEYERFLEGLAVACSEWACPVLGGNIKDGPEFSVTGTAIGTVKREFTMKRTGAEPGNKICVIGEMGLFWAAVLSAMLNIKLELSLQQYLDDALYKPIPRIREGILLGESGYVTACMDSSDGIAGCLYELAVTNQVDFFIDLSSLKAHAGVQLVADKSKVDAEKLMLSWGGWELVCTVHSEAIHDLRKLVESLGARFSIIGEVKSGSGKVWIQSEDRVGPLANLASERFCGTSIFTHGLDAYLDFLRSVPLRGN